MRLERLFAADHLDLEESAPAHTPDLNAVGEVEPLEPGGDRGRERTLGLAGLVADQGLDRLLAHRAETGRVLLRPGHFAGGRWTQGTEVVELLEGVFDRDHGIADLGA
jgi:hypothetical protein